MSTCPARLPPEHRQDRLIHHTVHLVWDSRKEDKFLPGSFKDKSRGGPEPVGNEVCAFRDEALLIGSLLPCVGGLIRGQNR